MKKDTQAFNSLQEAVKRHAADAARVQESETGRLAALEDTKRRRDEALQEDRLDDYRFYCERVNHFENMSFELAPADFSKEIDAVVESWGDEPGDALKALAVAVVDRIAKQGELLKLLGDGYPLPAGLPWFDDAGIVRALVADGLLSAADWLWFTGICLDHYYIDRDACEAKLRQFWETVPMIAAQFPQRGRLGSVR